MKLIKLCLLLIPLFINPIYTTRAGVRENSSISKTDPATINSNHWIFGRINNISPSAFGLCSSFMKQPLLFAFKPHFLPSVEMFRTSTTKGIEAKSCSENYKTAPLSFIGFGGVFNGVIKPCNLSFDLLPSHLCTPAIETSSKSSQSALGKDGDFIFCDLNSVCSDTLAPICNLQVIESQRCNSPATLLLSGFLRTETTNCAAENYTFEFTKVVGCNDPTPIGVPFTATTNSRIISLALPSGTTPANHTIQPHSFYSVRVRPNYKEDVSIQGTYGTSQIIAIAGVEFPSDPEMESTKPSQEGNVEAILYPNPNEGDEFDLYSRNIRSGSVEVIIIDALGNKIHAEESSVDEYFHVYIKLTSPLVSGFYYVRICDGDRVAFLKMFVN